MRVEKKKSKVKEMVVIPEDFVAFMNNVAEAIRNRDDSAALPSDDLLQCDCAYGGLIDESGESRYGFTYFPIENIRPKWELLFSIDEINRIATGSMTEIPLWTCSDKTCGCKFWDSNDSCFYCDWTGSPDI